MTHLLYIARIRALTVWGYSFHPENRYDPRYVEIQMIEPSTWFTTWPGHPNRALDEVGVQ